MRAPSFDKAALQGRAALLFALMTLSSVAAGTEKTAEDLTNLDLATLVNMDVIVTARKREENVRKVPISLTAVSGEQLKERSVVTLADLQAQVPSLYVQPSGEHPEEYYNAAVSLESLGIDAGYVAPPATFGIQANKKFGGK